VPPLRRDLGRFSPGGRFARLLQQADAALHGLISARRRSGGPPAIIDLLLAARDEEGRPLSDAELRDELITLLIAGHETTATALSWTLAWVRRDPGVQARLCDELRSAGGDDALPYTTAVCNEGLRVTPTIPVVARVPRQPVQLAGHEIAAPTALVPCILQVHRDPALYPEPERFRPERFLEQRHAAWEFFPFGGGVRRCIGAGLALLEMKAVLSALFTRHDATPIADPRPPRPRRSGVTLRPADDEPLRLRPLPGHATTASAVSAGAAAPIVAA
jgi:cytochrome P450